MNEATSNSKSFYIAKESFNKMERLSLSGRFLQVIYPVYPIVG